MSWSKDYRNEVLEDIGRAPRDLDNWLKFFSFIVKPKSQDQKMSF